MLMEWSVLLSCFMTQRDMVCSIWKQITSAVEREALPTIRVSKSFERLITHKQIKGSVNGPALSDEEGMFTCLGPSRIVDTKS
jgi:hypothetical protein